jgi:hypothetical protein
VIKIIPPKKGMKKPLLFRRPGEPALPAYLHLDLERRVVCFVYWERNSEPLNVTLGHALWRQIEPGTSRAAAVKIAKELRPLLERVCDGYSVGWDGRNHVGELDADAEVAKAELTARMEEALEPLS